MRQLTQTTSQAKEATQNVRRHSESASTRRISAESSLRAAQRERFDTHDLCRGSAELETHSHGATARALERAPSPQRVRRDQDTFARRCSEGASTRSRTGFPSSRHIRTAPQRERLGTRNVKTNSHRRSFRRGFPFVLRPLEVSETLRLPRNSQTLFVKMLRLPRNP